MQVLSARTGVTVAPPSRAPLGDLGHRQLGAGGHMRRQRLDRAGEAQDHAQLDHLALGGAGPARSAAAAVASKVFSSCVSLLGSLSHGPNYEARPQAGNEKRQGGRGRPGARRRDLHESVTPGPRSIRFREMAFLRSRRRIIMTRLARRDRLSAWPLSLPRPAVGAARPSRPDRAGAVRDHGHRRGAGGAMGRGLPARRRRW